MNMKPIHRRIDRSRLIPRTLLMVSLAAESSLIMFQGFDGVRERTLAAMLLIEPVVRILTRMLNAEPRIHEAAEQERVRI